MKKSKNNNIILGFGYWVFEFGFSWCKGKVITDLYLVFLKEGMSHPNFDLFLTSTNAILAGNSNRAWVPLLCSSFWPAYLLNTTAVHYCQLCHITSMICKARNLWFFFFSLLFSCSQVINFLKQKHHWAVSCPLAHLSFCLQFLFQNDGSNSIIISHHLS